MNRGFVIIRPNPFPDIRKESDRYDCMIGPAGELTIFYNNNNADRETVTVLAPGTWSEINLL